MLGLCLFDYVFWLWCPLCLQNCKLVQCNANTPARRGGDTLAASQVQPEHCPNLNVFILKFWLCSFDDMFWSWCSLCPPNCNSTQIHLPEGVKAPWLQLKCNLRIAQLWIPSIKGLDCVYVIVCFGHGVHCVHRAANLSIVLQIHLIEGVEPPWLQLKCNLSIPQL